METVSTCLRVALAILALPAGSFAADLAAPTSQPASPLSRAAASEAADADDLRMKQLEAEVDVLKDKVFKSKARLLLLQETVLHGATAGAIAKVRFRNEMGGAYRLESMTWVLDGQTIYSEVAGAAGSAPAPIPADPATKAPADPSSPSSALAQRKELSLFDGAIVPGSHNLSVTLVYRGSGYQVFSYLEGYKFTVQSSYTFQVEEGKTTDLEVTAYEKDGLTTAYEERPDVRFTVSTRESVILPDAGVPGGRASPEDRP